MKAVFFVKIEAKKPNKYSSIWNFGSVSAFKTKPSTKANEISIRLEVNVPDKYFDVPELQAKITVPDDAINNVISPDVESNIAQIISEQLGMRVNVSAQPEAEKLNNGENK